MAATTVSMGPARIAWSVDGSHGAQVGFNRYGFPTRLPEIVPDLTVVPDSPLLLGQWEHLAVRSYVAAPYMAAQWAAARTVPTLDILRHQHARISSGALAGNLTTDDDLHVSQAANLLLALGYTDLVDLWEVADRYGVAGQLSQSWADERRLLVPVLTERFRRGYRIELIRRLENEGLDWHEFLDAWSAQFPLHDLDLAFNAGLTGPEVEAIVWSGQFPDRAGLDFLVAMRQSACVMPAHG